MPRRPSLHRQLAGLAVLLVAMLAAAPAVGMAPSHGVATGDVTPQSAVLWARAPSAATLSFSLRAAGSETPRSWRVAVDAETDFTARVAVDGLEPDTEYRWWAWVGAEELDSSAAAEARFRTPPRPEAAAPVRLAFGGDIAGQNVCRDRDRGLPVFRVLRAFEPDLFVGLGDLIYADDVCKPVGRYLNLQIPGTFEAASDLAGFRAHWAYVRDDPHLQALLAATPFVPIWDDHEVVNDADPHSAPELMPLGQRAFFEWSPVEPGDGARRLYRRQRWGGHLELFVLDTRQYRDPNRAPDDGEAPKTMLGEAQRAWLLEALADSDATWKVIASSVPLSVATGTRPDERGRDGWSGHDLPTGFGRELRSLLEGIHAAGVEGTLWISTDVHYASVFRYAPLAEAPEFRFLELVTGPLHAMVAPAGPYDTSLGTEQLFVHAPDPARPIRTFREALGFFNFGALEVDASGVLTLRILNANGRELWRRTLRPGR